MCGAAGSSIRAFRMYGPRCRVQDVPLPVAGAGLGAACRFEQGSVGGGCDMRDVGIVFSI